MLYTQVRHSEMNADHTLCLFSDVGREIRGIPPFVQRECLPHIQARKLSSTSYCIIFGYYVNYLSISFIPGATVDVSVKIKSGQCTTHKPWWRHQMETFSALLALCKGNPSVTGGFPSQRLVTQSLMFSLVCLWTNVWANSRDAGDLRCHDPRWDITAMNMEYLESTMEAHVFTFWFAEIAWHRPLPIIVINTTLMCM